MIIKLPRAGETKSFAHNQILRMLAGMIHACPPTMPPSRLISRQRSFPHLFDSHVSEQTLNVCDFSTLALMDAYGSIQTKTAREIYVFI